MGWIFVVYLIVLYYEIFGSGREVVLLPGLLASTKYWQEIIPELSKSNRVIVIDQLGFGNSPKPDSEVEYAINDNVRYYIEVFKNLNLRKVILVGYSSSTILAIRLAAQYPDLVDKVLLITPPIHFSKESAIDSLNKSFRTYKYYMHGPLKLGFIFFVSIFRRLLIFAAPLFITHIQPDSAKDVFKFSWKSLYNSIENIIVNQDVKRDLKNIRCKIKILYAKIDNIVNKDNLFELSNEFKNIELQEIDSTHQIPLQKPEVVINEILNLRQEP